MRTKVVWLATRSNESFQPIKQRTGATSQQRNPNRSATQSKPSEKFGLNQRYSGLTQRYSGLTQRYSGLTQQQSTADANSSQDGQLPVLPF